MKTVTQSQKQSADTRYAQEMSSLLQLATEHLAELGGTFGPDRLEELVEALSAYQTSRQQYLFLGGYRVDQTTAVSSLIEGVGRLRLEVSFGFHQLAKDGVQTPPVKASAQVRSAKQCAIWLEQMRSPVESHAQALSAWIDDPMERLQALQQQLDATLALQQKAAPDLAAAGSAMSAAHRTLDRLAEVLRFAGRLAFKGQPELLRRLRRQRRVRQQKKVAAKAAAAA